MLNMISWGKFIEATLLLTSIYYLVVCTLYYRKEIAALLKGQRPKIDSVANETMQVSGKENPEENQS